MKGYLSVVEGESGSVKIESRAEVYRSSGETEEILVETEGRTVSLGISDVTVSRKKGEQAPILIEPSAEFIGIRNEGNANEITVRTNEGETQVSEGRLVNVSRDAELSVGYNAELQLIVEREARIEQNVVNEGDGDVVLGDQRNVDNSTSVGDDNVINRTDIGGDGAEAVGDDNVRNRSSVGADEATSERGESGDGDTQFCISCGTELPAEAVACFACGKSLESDGGSASEETRGYCKRHQRTYTGESCPACRDGR